MTEAAQKLLEEKGLADISISEITKAEQVSRNSFYRNFADKRKLFRSI
ncbi:TetR/AcrR family transcriptional regulator [Paenibacillus dakarensis]